MTQTIKVERKFDFVINLLTSLDNICFEMESNSITGYLSKRSDLSFENIQEQLESFGLDTSDNERQTGKIIVPLTGTNIFYDTAFTLRDASPEDILDSDFFTGG